MIPIVAELPRDFRVAHSSVMMIWRNTIVVQFLESIVVCVIENEPGDVVPDRLDRRDGGRHSGRRRFPGPDRRDGPVSPPVRHFARSPTALVVWLVWHPWWW